MYVSSVLEVRYEPRASPMSFILTIVILLSIDLAWLTPHDRMIIFIGVIRRLSSREISVLALSQHLSL